MRARQRKSESKMEKEKEAREKLSMAQLNVSLHVKYSLAITVKSVVTSAQSEVGS